MNLKNQQINLALQVLPSGKKHTYALVDEAIDVIAKSGLKYRVSPFETVIEGPYEKVMEVVLQAQEACYNHGAEEMMTFIKIQSSLERPVMIEDKMEKYDSGTNLK